MWGGGRGEAQVGEVTINNVGLCIIMSFLVAVGEGGRKDVLCGIFCIFLV